MMKYASPAQYSQLIKTIPVADENVSVLAAEICDKLLQQTEELFESYPYVSGSGRPLRSATDHSGVTSIETYQLGELLTYSFHTLRRLNDHLHSLQNKGRSLARDILENSVRHYGYKTLEEAEAATKAHIDSQGIEISFGCGDC
jgi:hypothetical protein